MEIFLFYLLRVTIAATILYLFFKFILSKRTFHAINRMVVLGIVVMTLVLPLFTVELPEISFFQPKVETTTTQLTIEEALAYLNAASYSNTPAVTPTPVDAEIPWLKMLGVIYLIGFSVALLRFAISFIRMSRIIYQTKKVLLDDNSMLCISDKKVSPFSWMKFVVLSKDDFTDDSRDIIRHEQAHVAFGHSYDLLFLDLYSLVFWFNPFAWLLRLELQTIHEYQADEKVLTEGANAKNYHLSLIRQCVGEHKFALANNFEYNNLHKRIKMTLKTKSSSRQKWLYGTIGLSVMLCIVVLSFNGLKAKAADLKEMIQSELLPATDSTQNSTPAAVRIRKVDVKNNATIASPIIIDTVALDTKIRVRLSQNEDIRVVGYGTLNGAKPLIIVNGKESTNGMSSIAENDISSIQVLKDASATKLYGEKGKDGVILITNKEDLTTSKKSDEIKIVDYGGLKGVKPLILVDGKEAPDNYMQNVVPETIGNITVLKDASATAVYGVKGKNGVVLITTRQYSANHKDQSDKNVEIRVIGNGTQAGGSKASPIMLVNEPSKDVKSKDKVKIKAFKIVDYKGLNGAEPLILVDGKESPSNFRQTIIYDDIESITVLKDTASTSVYGVKGKNGVILVKMKKK